MSDEKKLEAFSKDYRAGLQECNHEYVKNYICMECGERCQHTDD